MSTSAAGPTLSREKARTKPARWERNRFIHIPSNLRMPLVSSQSDGPGAKSYAMSIARLLPKTRENETRRELIEDRRALPCETAIACAERQTFDTLL